MAIVVPFIASAGLGAIGITGVAATIASVATSVVFQVTGVNDKINKAASKVFGEDLVQIANIAGAVYGAWNGGFSLDPAKEFMDIGNAAASGAEAATAMNVPTGAEMGNMGNAFEAQMAGLGRSPTSINLSDLATADAAGTAEGFVNNATATAEPVGSSLTQKTNIITGTTDGIGTNAKPLTGGVEATNSKYALTEAARPSAAAQTASGTGISATASNATSGLGLQAPGGALAPQTSSNVFTNIFNKMGDKTIAGVIQGGATAAGNYMTAQDRLKAEEEARRINPSTRRGYTYKAA